MKSHNNSQLSFDLGHENLKSVDMIAASYNDVCKKIISDSHNWPGSVICLKGPDASGIKTLASEWARSNSAQVFDNSINLEIDHRNKYYLIYWDLVKNEDLLFALFQLGESKRVLVVSHFLPNLWDLNSADLRSRTNSMSVFQTRELTEEFFSQIMTNALGQFGLKPKKSEIIGAFSRQIRSFSLILKIFSHISMIMQNEGKLKTADLKPIFYNFANNEMNKNLFDDNTISQSEQ